MSDQGPSGPDDADTEKQSSSSIDRHLKQEINPHVAVCPLSLPHLSDTFSEAVVHDFNDKNKTKAYLSLKDTEFSFIGPDREHIETNSLETYVDMASTFRSTGVPNYKQTRFPSSS